jgi:hypothetical protein
MRLVTTSRPPLVQLPGGPDPNRPVPRDPVDGYDLGAYASVVARLADRGEPRARVLARAGLDEQRWLKIEKTWLVRIATAFLQDDPSLGKEHDDAFQAAQNALAGEPETSLADYANLVAQIEEGRAPAQAIAAAGLTPSGFAQVQRRWAATIAADGDLASSFRAMVAARRGA